MKKSELKKILKPLINECIKESLLEDGLISGIIAEVVKGVGGPQPIVESQPPREDPVSEQSNKLKEHKSKLMSAIGGNAYNGVNLFEGTTPAPAQASPQQQAQPMTGQSPDDPGVDITGLLGSVGRNWNAHMTDVKEGK